MLIAQLRLLQDLYTLLEPRNDVPVTLCIPRIVVAELDGLKNATRLAGHTSVGESARRATTWLLSVLSLNRTGIIRGQRREETLLPQNRDKSENNDSYVLDVALHAHSVDPNRRVVLLSDDKVLVLRARIEGTRLHSGNQ